MTVVLFVAWQAPCSDIIGDHSKFFCVLQSEEGSTAHVQSLLHRSPFEHKTGEAPRVHPPHHGGLQTLRSNAGVGAQSRRQAIV